MKIKITYLPEEERDATASAVAFLRLHPGAKIRKSETHPPHKHIYIATKKDGSSCRSKDSP